MFFLPDGTYAAFLKTLQTALSLLTRFSSVCQIVKTWLTWLLRWIFLSWLPVQCPVHVLAICYVTDRATGHSVGQMGCVFVCRSAPCWSVSHSLFRWCYMLIIEFFTHSNSSLDFDIAPTYDIWFVTLSTGTLHWFNTHVNTLKQLLKAISVFGGSFLNFEKMTLMMSSGLGRVWMA